jgi:hypothetical protein
MASNLPTLVGNLDRKSARCRAGIFRCTSFVSRTFSAAGGSQFQ